MKSSSEIRMDFRKTIRRAERLESMAEELKRLEAPSDFFWEGGAADVWKKGRRTLWICAAESAADMARMAAEMRRTASRIYDAEMHALRTAGERTYQ